MQSRDENNIADIFCGGVADMDTHCIMGSRVSEVDGRRVDEELLYDSSRGEVYDVATGMGIDVVWSGESKHTKEQIIEKIIDEIRR